LWLQAKTLDIPAIAFADDIFYPGDSEQKAVEIQLGTERESQGEKEDDMAFEEEKIEKANPRKFSTVDRRAHG
jgi:hypothetical protein